MRATRRNYITLAMAVFAVAAAFLCSCDNKTDEQKILDTLNGYLKEHALGNYDKSYQYLASSEKAKQTEEQWIAKNMTSLNPIRIMRNPKLVDLKITGDSAEGKLEYMGIPNDKLSGLIGDLYSKNLTMYPTDRIALIEKELTAHFDEVSAPMARTVRFAKEGRKWKLIL